MQAAAQKPHEFTGRHMLAIVLSFFAVIIGVNLLMAYLANSTWSGLVVANGYVASQSFNADEATARAQDALGWKIGVAHDAVGLTFSFSNRYAAPIGGLSVTGQLRRPTTERNDQMLTFVENGHGAYAASANLAAGIWDVEVNASERGAVAYHKIFRIVVK